MPKLSLNKVISLLDANCKHRKSCYGCLGSGVGSLRNTCLIRELRNTPQVDKKQETLPLKAGDVVRFGPFIGVMHE